MAQTCLPVTQGWGKTPTKSQRVALSRAFDERNAAACGKMLIRMARAGRDLSSLWENPGFGDAFRDFAAEAVATYFLLRKGDVYVAYNPARLDLAKIGFTRKGIPARMQSLSGTSHVADWYCPVSIPSLDAPWLEARVHAALAAKAVAKEFYAVGWEEFRSIAKSLANEDAARLTRSLGPMLP